MGEKTMDDQQIRQMLYDTATKYIQSLMMSGQINQVEASTLTSQLNGWLPQLAAEVYRSTITQNNVGGYMQVCMPNMDAANQHMVARINQLAMANRQSSIGSNMGGMQPQMGMNNINAMYTGGQTNMGAMQQPMQSNFGNAGVMNTFRGPDLYAKNTNYLNPNQQTPSPPIQMTPELRSPVQGRVEGYNNNDVARLACNDQAVNLAVTSPALVKSHKAAMELSNSVVDTTISGEITAKENKIYNDRVTASKLEDTGLYITGYKDILTSRKDPVSHSYIESLIPYSSLNQAKTEILGMLSDNMLLATHEYYAHLVTYPTMYVLRDAPLYHIRESLDKAVALKNDANDVQDVKWSSLIAQLGSVQNESKILYEKLSYQLNLVSRCIFNFRTDAGKYNTAIIEHAGDALEILDGRDGCAILTSTPQSKHRAYMELYNALDRSIPDKLYLNPEIPEDQVYLCHRADSGIVYGSKLLRYQTSTTLYEEDGTLKKEVKDLISKDAVLLQRNTVLFTNIPFADEVLRSLVSDQKMRSIIPQPRHLLESILLHINLPTQVYNNEHTLFFAGKNLHGELTVFPI